MRVSSPLPGRWWMCRTPSGFRYSLADGGHCNVIAAPLHLLHSLGQLTTNAMPFARLLQEGPSYSKKDLMGYLKVGVNDNAMGVWMPPPLKMIGRMCVLSGGLCKHRNTCST